MVETNFKQQIAHTLKALRHEKGLSLDATAKLTGVSKANLGQIERQETSPTIATLWKIASGLNTSFSAFFAHAPELQKSEKIFPNDNNMQINTLFPFQADTGLEVFEITLMNHHEQMSEPHQIGVMEHVLVLEGCVEVFYEGQWHRLNEQQTVRFRSDQPHGYRAITESTRFQNIICYPR